MTDTYLVIQALGFATGTALFIVLALLSWRSSHVSMITHAGSNSGLAASATALLWNVSNLTKYALILCGIEPASPALRVADVVAYSALALLSTALLMLVASGYARPWQSSPSRLFRSFSYAVAALMPTAFIVAALTDNTLIEFDTLKKLSVYNLCLHVAAAFLLFHNTRQLPAARSYSRSMLALLAVLSATVLFLMYFAESGRWLTALSVISQQCSIVIALITFAFLSRHTFADVFVRGALLILTSVAAAFCYGSLIVEPLTRIVQGASPRPAAAAWARDDDIVVRAAAGIPYAAAEPV